MHTPGTGPLDGMEIVSKEPMPSMRTTAITFTEIVSIYEGLVADCEAETANSPDADDFAA